MKKSLCILTVMAFFAPALAEERPTSLESKSIEGKVQTTTPSKSNLHSEEPIDKIKVTGSRINRIGTEGPSPLYIYSQEDLENSGYSSAGDFLRDTTISHFGVGREQSGRSTAGVSSAGIKGEQALILINGLRVVEDPHANAVDLNLIPLFAIERVEILKDGASALYGSDAVGGVINFITKKDFSGIELQAQASPTAWPLVKGGSRGDIAVIAGESSRDWSYISSFHLRFQDQVHNADRAWTKKSISPIGPYGIFTVGRGKPYIDPSCPNITSDGCEFNVAGHSSKLPRQSQLYGYLQADYKIFGENKLYTQVLSSWKNTNWFYAPVPGGLPIPAQHKMSYATGQPGVLRFRFMEAGKRDTTTNNFAGDLTVGLRGWLSHSWDYDINLKLAHITKNNKEKGLLLKKELTQAILTGVYDPFNKSRRDLSTALYTAKDNNDSILLSSSLDFSGDLGFLSKTLNDLNLATGIQAYFKNYDQNADKKSKAGEILSNAGGDGYGERFVLSHYFEMGHHFSEILELQLAGRTDYYSDDFGSTFNPKGAFRFQPWLKPMLKIAKKLTFNPKVAVRFQPHSRFFLRGSVGTAFVAPSLDDLNQSDFETYPWIFDTVACYNELKSQKSFATTYKALGEMSVEKKEEFVKDFLIEQKDVMGRRNLKKTVLSELKKLSQSFPQKDYCKDRQVKGMGKGNKKLKETKAIVASLGSVSQITDEHSLTLDLWYIRKSGVPGYGLGKKTIDSELNFGNDYVAKKGVTVKRKSSQHNPIDKIQTKLLNLGKTHISGVDIDWESDMTNIRIPSGNPYFKSSLSYILFFRKEDFPGIGYVDKIGKFGSPRWRNISSFGWKNNKHNISLTAHIVSPFNKRSSELEDLPLSIRWDLDYQFIMSEKTSIRLGWSNLLFQDPPYDKEAESNQLDHDIFESRGPFFFAGIKHKI